MTDFEKVLITRDDLSPGDAFRAKKQAKNHILVMLAGGGSYDDVENYLQCEWGLEMDYITDLIEFGSFAI